MRILVIIPSYIPAYIYGGPIHSVSALNEALVDAGHSVTVYTSNANGKPDLEVELNKLIHVNQVAVYYFRRWTKDHSNFTPSLLQALWRSAPKMDAVHIHAWWNLISIPAVIVCLLRGVRPVLSPRGAVTPYTFKHRKAILKKCFHIVIGSKLMRSCILHVTSSRERNDVQDYVKGAEIHLLPNLLKLGAPQRLEYQDEDRLSLIYIGRIDPKKNIEFVLDVVGSGLEIPYKLIFIGDGPEGYLQSLKQSVNGNDHIQWIGPVYDQSKWAHLAAADILLLPSHNENYGNVVLEALSQGAGAMLSEHVGLKDYVLENKLGWVPGNTPQAWRESLINIWRDKDILRSIRHRAPDCIKRDFQQEAIVDDYISMYRASAL